MTVETLQLISLASYIVAAVLFLVGIALFFLLDVPKVYNDITGRTAKRRIEEIRQQNESTGNKAYKPSKVNAERGKLTDKITESGRLARQTSGLAVSVGTEKFETGTLFPHGNETSVLEGGSNETSLLDSGANETTMLTANIPPASNETTLLVNTAAAAAPAEPSAEVTGDFTVDVEMAFTGSAEIIE